MEWDFKQGYSVAKDLILLAAVVYTWWSNREKVTARRFAALEKEVATRITSEALRSMEKEREAGCDLHEQRTKTIELDLKRIENELRHVPNHNDLSRIHGRIDEMHGSLRELAGGVKGLGHQMNLVLEELIKR